MLAPKFLGNGEVTSKSTDERAGDRKPDQNWGVRAGLPGEAGAGPRLAEGSLAEAGEVGLGRGHGCPMTLDTSLCLSGPLPIKWGANPQPHMGR